MSTLKQYVFNSASILDSSDVLHSCLSLAIAYKYMPGDARSINKKQFLLSLMEKSLFRTSKRIRDFDRRADLSVKTEHYVLFLFAPIVLEFLAGKIALAEDVIKLYLDTVNDIVKELKMQKLAKGVQQFRFVIKKSHFSEIIDEDSAARVWLKLFGGEDMKLPQLEKETKKRRERDEEHEAEEEVKGDPMPLKHSNRDILKRPKVEEYRFNKEVISHEKEGPFM